jgi:hypothetical protein
MGFVEMGGFKMQMQISPAMEVSIPFFNTTLIH